jgi:hypothetical protein
MAFSLATLAHRMRTASRGERELWFAGCAIAFGLFVLPFLIYLAGKTTLGPHEQGGLGAYLLDFLKGLVRPHAAYWLIVLGPYLIISLGRGLWLTRRRLRANAAAQSSPPAPPPGPGRRR